MHEIVVGGKWVVVAAAFAINGAVGLSKMLAQEVGGVSPGSFADFADQGMAIVLGLAFMWAVLTGKIRFHDENEAEVRNAIRDDIRDTKEEVSGLKTEVSGLKTEVSGLAAKLQ